MSRTSLQDTSDRTPDVSARPRVSRRSGSRKSNQSAAVTGSSKATGDVHPHRSEGSTIRAPMDLALPRLTDSGDLPVRPDHSWIVTTDSPAAPVRLTGLNRTPSPCMNLDALSSDESDEAAGLLGSFDLYF